MHERGTYLLGAAILAGSALVAAALVFHAGHARYEGGMSNGLYVRLDTRTGLLSACVMGVSGPAFCSPWTGDPIADDWQPVSAAGMPGIPDAGKATDQPWLNDPIVKPAAADHPKQP